MESVDTLNKDKIYPIISSVIRQTFFKFFRVSLSVRQNVHICRSLLVVQIANKSTKSSRYMYKLALPPVVGLLTSSFRCTMSYTVILYT